MPTTLPPTTLPPTTKPPGECPCNEETLTAYINTKYFANKLGMADFFIFPIKIELAKNENYDADDENNNFCYSGNVQTVLKFCDDNNSLREKNPELLEIVSIDARLNYEDDDEKWTFKWATTFKENDIHIVELYRDSSDCPFGKFRENPEDEIEIVCIKDPNAEEEELEEEIDVLVWNTRNAHKNLHPFDRIKPTGEYGKDQQLVKLLKNPNFGTETDALVDQETTGYYRNYLGDVHFYDLGFDRGNDGLPHGDNHRLTMLFVELFINKCNNTKVFKFCIFSGLELYLEIISTDFYIQSQNDVRSYIKESNDYGNETYRLSFFPDNGSKSIYIRTFEDLYFDYWEAYMVTQKFLNVLLLVPNALKSRPDCLPLDIDSTNIDDVETKLILAIATGFANITSLIAPIDLFFGGLPLQDEFILFFDQEGSPILEKFIPGADGYYYGNDFGKISHARLARNDQKWQNVDTLGTSVAVVDLSKLSDNPKNNKFDRMVQYTKPFYESAKQGFFMGKFDFDSYGSMNHFEFFDIAYETPNKKIITFTHQSILFLAQFAPANNPIIINDGFAFTHNMYPNHVYICNFYYVAHLLRLLDVIQKLDKDAKDVFDDLRKISMNIDPDSVEKLKWLVNNSFKFRGDDGDTATISIQGEDFVIKNDNNQLVFDYEGSQEHTFTEIGETYNFIANNSTYNITFDGFGSLLFSIENDNIPNLEDFDTYITESSFGVNVIDSELFFKDFEIGFNIIDEEDLTGDLVSYNVRGIALEIDAAYDKSIFIIINKNESKVIYFFFDADDNSNIDVVIGDSPFSNFDTKFLKNSLLDSNKIPNFLPRPTSGNGVEIVSLSSDHTGISFNPIDDDILTGNLIDINVFGSEFKIDAAYSGTEFCLNQLRTPINNSSTMFTFLSTLEYPINTYRSSKIMDSERFRMRLYGYY